MPKKQAIRRHKNLPDLFSCFLLRFASSLRYGVLDLVRNTCAGSASPEHHKAGLIPPHATDLECGHDRSKSHAACALYIVVETCNLWSVLVKDSPCVVQAKVFEMNICSGVALPRSFDKGVNKLVVLFARCAGLSQTEIEVVIEQLLVLMMCQQRCCSKGLAKY